LSPLRSTKGPDDAGAIHGRTQLIGPFDRQQATVDAMPAAWVHEG
jgi:hypothetical protein